MKKSSILATVFLTGLLAQNQALALVSHCTLKEPKTVEKDKGRICIPEMLFIHFNEGRYSLNYSFAICDQWPPGRSSGGTSTMEAQWSSIGPLVNYRLKDDDGNFTLVLRQDHKNLGEYELHGFLDQVFKLTCN